MNWKWSGEPGMDLHEALRAACRLLRFDVESYLEIGVDCGGSLNTVLNEVKPERIVLCDIWNPNYCDHGEPKPHVMEILTHFGAKAIFLDGDSKVWIPTLTESFDLVLVDGDHSAGGARADLRAAWPRVERGGVLVMDDLNHPNYPWMTGVFEAEVARWVDARMVDELHGECSAALVRKV